MCSPGSEDRIVLVQLRLPLEELRREAAFEVLPDRVACDPELSIRYRHCLLVQIDHELEVELNFDRLVSSRSRLEPD